MKDFQPDDTQIRGKSGKEVFYHGKVSKELPHDLVNNQNFTSTTEILNSIKELFSDVL